MKGRGMAQEFGTVVIGAGVGGGTVVESLRDTGYAASIALVGADPAAPYFRPDLSKMVMIEGSDANDSAQRGNEWYSAQDISKYFGTPVPSLDPPAQTVTLENGEQPQCGQAILSTGS